MDATQNTQIDPNGYRVQESPSPFVSQGSQQLGKNEFLQLLVAQLENQDPLEPMKDTEFISQLATFSSLEELTDLNTRMDTMIGAQDRLVNSQSVDLVGREVYANTGGTLQVGASGHESVVYDLTESVSAVRVEIQDENGKTVRTIEAPEGKLGPGRHHLDWDGLDENGVALDEGLYKFKVIASDAAGAETRVTGMVALTVEGLNVGSDGLFLLSGQRVLGFDEIVEIRTRGDGTSQSAQPDAEDDAV